MASMIGQAVRVTGPGYVGDNPDGIHTVHDVYTDDGVEVAVFAEPGTSGSRDQSAPLASLKAVRTARCASTYPGVTLKGKTVRCESAAGHDGRHGHSFAARYWED